MILNNAIIEDIKEKSSLLFDKAGDFSILSSLIFKETGRNIGVTTLKRLFHYIQDDRKASEYTLNTIALYVGYNSWEEYSSAKNLVSDWGYNDETLYIHALEINTKIFVYKIRKGEILEAEKVIRGDSIGNYKTHGEIINVELIKD